MSPERIQLIQQSRPSVIQTSKSNNKPIASRISSRDYRNEKIERISLNAKYRTLFGNPSKDFYMMVDGLPGHGKSYWVMEFAEYYNRQIGNVIYYAAEQNGQNLALQEMQNTLETTFTIERQPKKLSKSDMIKDFNQYDLVVIDSINEMGLSAKEIKDIRDASGAAIVGILQSTKDGQFKGGQEYLHDVDISVKLNTFKPEVIKSRYKSIHDEKDRGRVVKINL